MIQYLADAVPPMLRGRYTETIGRTLFSTVAEATLLAAWMSYDSCEHGLARRYFIQALRLAEAGQDQRLAAVPQSRAPARPGGHTLLPIALACYSPAQDERRSDPGHGARRRGSRHRGARPVTAPG